MIMEDKATVVKPTRLTLEKNQNPFQAMARGGSHSHT